MGRIRTIKPEFPQSESIGRLSREARLLFILLWTIADDSGRARASSRGLAGDLYRYDDDAVELLPQWLVELEAQGHIRRYVQEGSSYLDIPKWREHQKIDRPSPSRLPPFVEHSSEPREVSTSVQRGLDDGPVPVPGPGPGPGRGNGPVPGGDRDRGPGPGPGPDVALARARATTVDNSEAVAKKQQLDPARSFASAPDEGALAREPDSTPAEPKRSAEKDPLRKTMAEINYEAFGVGTGRRKRTY